MCLQQQLLFGKLMCSLQAITKMPAAAAQPEEDY